MPQVVSGSVLGALQGASNSISSYKKLKAQEDANRRAQEAHAAKMQAFELDFEQAAQQYQREASERQSSLEYDLGQLQEAGGERVAGIEREAGMGYQQGQQAMGGLAGGGMMALPGVAAIAQMVPEEVQSVQQELGRLEGIASKMSPEHRQMLLDDYEQGTVQRLNAAASRKVLGRISDIRMRGSFQVEGEAAGTGEDGQPQGMGGQMDAMLSQVEQAVTSGDMNPLEAQAIIDDAQQQVIAENTRRQFFQQGVARIDRELQAVEPGTEDAEELAFVRARWMAGDIENGEDLEDAIFEARTGRQTARGSEPKTPEELYQRTAEMLLKINPTATQEQIDQAFSLVAAGPPAQRRGGLTQAEAMGKDATRKYGEAGPSAAVAKAIELSGAGAGVPRGTSGERGLMADTQAAQAGGQEGFDRIVEKRRGAAPKEGKATQESPASARNGQDSPGPTPKEGEATPDQGAPPDVVPWDKASTAVRKQAKDAVIELIQKPGGNVQDVPALLRKMGVTPGTIPRKDLEEIKKAARDAKEKRRMGHEERTREGQKKHGKAFV